MNTPSTSRVLRWLLGIGVACLAVLAAALGGVFLFAGQYDFAPFAAGRLSASLHRKVSITSLHVVPGRWLHVDLRGLEVANLPNGSAPTMLAVQHAGADVELVSLLAGPMVLRGVSIEGLQLLLERNADDLKNWKFSAAAQAAAPKPADRTKIPDLLDGTLAGDIAIRTTSGHRLEIHLNQLALQAGNDSQPVRLIGDGSYQGAPIKLQAEFGSLDALHHASVPYPSDIHAVSGNTTLQFTGTMTAPLDLDGATGKLELVAPSAAALKQIVGATGGFDAALNLAGAFTHYSPVWQLSQATGALNADSIEAATLKLEEGPHGKPDSLTMDLAFNHLDANALLADKKATGGSDSELSLGAVLTPGTLLTAKLSTQALNYAKMRATDLAFAMSLRPGRLAVDTLSLGYLGALLRASGQVEAMPHTGAIEGGHITADVDMARMDVSALAALLAVGAVPLQGRMDGKVLVDAEGATLNQAVQAARLSAAFTMDSGSIARQAIELASTDVRTLFRKAAGASPVSCLVAVVDIRAGVGTVSPLRIRAADGTITARGSFDLHRRLLDITVASNARTTGLLALDVPLHISGPFNAPSIVPAKLTAAGRAQLVAGDDVNRLLPGLQPFARRSPCLAVRNG